MGRKKLSAAYLLPPTAPHPQPPKKLAAEKHAELVEQALVRYLAHVVLFDVRLAPFAYHLLTLIGIFRDGEAGAGPVTGAASRFAFEH